MSAHAKLAPSAAARWIACPGSVRLSEEAPPQPPGAAAQEGTDAHTVASNMLLGETPSEHAYPGIELYVEHVRSTMNRKGVQAWIESRVHLTEEIHGTPDAVLHRRNELEVVDLKYGYNRVEARGNPQLMIYAAAAIATHGLSVRQVKLTIVQPRAGGIRSVTLRRKEFDALLAPITAHAEVALNAENPPRRAGEHCQYCPAAAICPERKQEALLLARLAFTEASSVDDATKVWVHVNSKRIADWLAQVSGHSLLQPPPGYRVLNGKGRRVWRTDIELPTGLKVLTLAEAQKAGHDLDALTVLKEGNPILVKNDSEPEDFSEI